MTAWGARAIRSRPCARRWRWRFRRDQAHACAAHARARRQLGGTRRENRARKWLAPRKRGAHRALRVVAQPRTFFRSSDGQPIFVGWDPDQQRFSVHVTQGSVGVSGSIVGAERPVRAGETLLVSMPQNRLQLTKRPGLPQPQAAAAAPSPAQAPAAAVEATPRSPQVASEPTRPCKGRCEVRGLLGSL